MKTNKLLAMSVSAALGAIPSIGTADVSVGGMAQVEIAREQTKNAAGATVRKETTV